MTRRDQRRRRRPGRKSSRCGRPGVELAAVRREGARPDPEPEVAVTFGCWTSVSRKSVLPVFEEL